MTWLADMVGDGELVGRVEVDQVYAHIQHESLDYRHPRGGQAMYLREPLFANFRSYLQSIANSLLIDGGRRAMIRAMEDLAEEGGVATFAPIEFGFLRASGYPTVTDNGAKIYDRAPRSPRLSEAELKALYRQTHPIPSRFTPKQLRWMWAQRVWPPPKGGR